jgi:hypothetical protein
VTPVTGAYGYSMASNYNRATRPAVIFVADGTARVVLRRESLEDLLRLELQEALRRPVSLTPWKSPFCALAFSGPASSDEA